MMQVEFVSGLLVGLVLFFPLGCAFGWMLRHESDVQPKQDEGE